MSLDFYLEEPGWVERASFNITHNLTDMARAAGIYEALWRPAEHGYETAGQIVPVLEAGIAAMKADPARFQRHNPENGWGSYHGFLPCLERVLADCKAYPHARVRACG
jgi:hypothetical protein